jgi:hypothetical protein
VIVCGLFEWKRICKGLLSFVFICDAIEDPIIKKEVIVDDVNFPMIYFPFIYFKSSAAPAYIARVMVLNAT